MSTIAREASDGGLAGQPQGRVIDNCSCRRQSDESHHPRFYWAFRAARRLPCAQAMSKRFVYVLRNEDSPPRYYTGVTSDVAARLAVHNAGDCIHTAKYRPWLIDLVVEFSDERRAVAFERYLKSGSGVAFAQRHLRQRPE
jgi:predicted GIY-YIG superfamily endonuclease